MAAQITTLPEGLTVGGWLDLNGTGITSLPEGLTVGGSLDLNGTGITTSRGSDRRWLAFPPRYADYHCQRV